MPVTPTYPGVYIEEVPSGVRTITGVATSITAFAGFAPRGATDSATSVLSWADYERKFGGLNKDSLMSYAVNQFFANGGNRAYIIRVVGTGALPATVTIDSKLIVNGKSVGTWATTYTIKTLVSSVDAQRFALQVLDATLSPVEIFSNLSMKTTDPRFAPNIINSQSDLISASKTGSSDNPPANTTAAIAGGNNGAALTLNSADFETALAAALKALDRVDLFNILCVPGETRKEGVSALQKFCRDRRAFLIVDCEQNATVTSLQNGPDSGITQADSINSALYFPWLNISDPLAGGALLVIPPCGTVAGIYARTDAQRGVWKAPAGTDASLSGISSIGFVASDAENGILNPKAVNVLRNFPVYGSVVWGARTLAGNDDRGSEWKYVPIRRLALFLEESLYRGTQWVVFEPNDEPLWAQIRLNVGAFMNDLFRQGAFQGKSPRDAYFVKCDSETTTQSDINRGIVNILVGFAPLKPAEFVILKIQQMAGQLQA
jgi:uncharacterized protein